MSDELVAISEQAKAFLASPFGKQYIAALGMQYNGLHQDAEREDLSPSQKAMKVERAAGVKFAISYLEERARYKDIEDEKKKAAAKKAAAIE